MHRMVLNAATECSLSGDVNF